MRDLTLYPLLPHPAGEPVHHVPGQRLCRRRQPETLSNTRPAALGPPHPREPDPTAPGTAHARRTKPGMDPLVLD